MDVKQYYKKLHELEATVKTADVIVVSNETPDGGTAGVMTEVPRRNACQLVLEGRARMANDAEAEAYRECEAAKRKEFVREQAASRIQYQLVPADVSRLGPAKTGN
jgi:hypothetical protein